MRKNILLLLIIQTVLLAAMVYGVLTSPTANAEGTDFTWPFIRTLALAYAVCALPAWAIAYANRWLPLGLVLACVIPVGFVLLFGLPA